MEETISRMAGAEWGIVMTPEQFDDAIRGIGRVPAVRTTTYDRVDAACRTRLRSIRLTFLVKPIDQLFSTFRLRCACQ